MTVKVYNHTYNVDPTGENTIEINHDQLYINIPSKDLLIDIDNRIKPSTTIEESAEEVVKAAGAVVESAGRAIVKSAETTEAEVEAAAVELAKTVIDISKSLDSTAVVLNEASKAVDNAQP